MGQLPMKQHLWGLPICPPPKPREKGIPGESQSNPGTWTAGFLSEADSTSVCPKGLHQLMAQGQVFTFLFSPLSAVRLEKNQVHRS